MGGQSVRLAAGIHLRGWNCTKSLSLENERAHRVYPRVQVLPVPPRPARIARGVFRDFGRRGSHPEELTFGDRFSCSPAIDNEESLLFPLWKPTPLRQGLH